MYIYIYERESERERELFIQRCLVVNIVSVMPWFETEGPDFITFYTTEKDCSVLKLNENKTRLPNYNCNEMARK